MGLLDFLGGSDPGAGDAGTGYASLSKAAGYGTSAGNLGDYAGQVFYGNDPQRVKDLQNTAGYWDNLAKNGLSQGQQDTLLASYAGDPSADAARATSALESDEVARGLSPGGSTDMGARAGINSNFIQAYNQAKARLGQTKMNLIPEAMANRDAAMGEITNPALKAAFNGWNQGANVYDSQAPEYFNLANQKRQAQQEAQNAFYSSVGGLAGDAIGAGWNPFGHATRVAAPKGIGPGGSDLAGTSSLYQG